MKQLMENEKYCLMSSMILNRKYYVVAIKKMLTVTDFIEISERIHKGSPKARIKLRFVAPAKEKFTATKNSSKQKPQQIQLTF